MPRIIYNMKVYKLIMQMNGNNKINPDKCSFKINNRLI